MSKDEELEQPRQENATLREQVALLRERIHVLEAQLAKDSHNSHLPPLRIAFIGHGLRNEMTVSKLHYVDEGYKPFHHYYQFAFSFLGVVPRQKDNNSSKAGPEPVHGEVASRCATRGVFVSKNVKKVSVFDLAMDCSSEGTAKRKRNG